MDFPMDVPMNLQQNCSQRSGPDGSVVAAGVKGKILLIKVWVGGQSWDLAKEVGENSGLVAGRRKK